MQKLGGGGSTPKRTYFLEGRAIVEVVGAKEVRGLEAKGPRACRQEEVDVLDFQKLCVSIEIKP